MRQYFGCCSGSGGKWRSHSEPEDASFLKPAIVVMQVAGVQAFINRPQVRNGQWEVPYGEGVLRHAHFAGKEWSVIPALSGGIQVDQAVSLVRSHSGGLEVPVSHLLLLLLEALSPQGAPVHTGQCNRAAQQDHEHCLLSIPVTFLFLCWKYMNVKLVYIS